MSASDYILVSANIFSHDYQHKKKGVGYRTEVNFVLADFSEMENYVLDQDFTLTFVSDNVDSIWMELRKVKVKHVFNLFHHTLANKRNCPHWFTHEVRHLINCVHTARRRKKQCPYLLYYSSWKAWKRG